MRPTAAYQRRVSNFSDLISCTESKSRFGALRTIDLVFCVLDDSKWSMVVLVELHKDILSIATHQTSAHTTTVILITTTQGRSEGLMCHRTIGRDTQEACVEHVFLQFDREASIVRYVAPLVNNIDVPIWTTSICIINFVNVFVVI